MKRFLIVIVPILFFILALVISKIELKTCLNDKESCDNKINDLGFALEVYCGEDYIKYYSENNVVGECVKLKKDKFKLNKLCDELGVTIINKYKVEDKLIMEGYSPRLKNYLKGRQSNIQIAINDDEIILGSPIIYGSY